MIKTIENEYLTGNLATGCLICGESVPILHVKDYPKICDKCREAVMKMREMIEKGEIK